MKLIFLPPCRKELKSVVNDNLPETEKKTID